MKRWRTPTAKPGELKVAYGKYEGSVDLFYCHGGCGASKSDSKMLSHFFESLSYDGTLNITGSRCNKGMNLRQELEDRGYDITTLKFTIQKKKDLE